MVLRLSAWGIFLLGAVGLLIHSTLLQTGHIRAGMFCFYTNLSNLLVLVYELALAIAAGLPHSAALRLLTDDTLTDGGSRLPAHPLLRPQPIPGL